MIDAWDEKYQNALRRRNNFSTEWTVADLDVSKIVGEFREIVRFFTRRIVDELPLNNSNSHSFVYGDIVFTLAVDYKGKCVSRFYPITIICSGKEFKSYSAG